jgi:hypothetical protein
MSSTFFEILSRPRSASRLAMCGSRGVNDEHFIYTVGQGFSIDADFVFRHSGSGTSLAFLPCAFSKEVSHDQI